LFKSGEVALFIYVKIPNVMPTHLVPGGSAAGKNDIGRKESTDYFFGLKKGNGQKWDVLDPLDIGSVFSQIPAEFTVYQVLMVLKIKKT